MKTQLVCLSRDGGSQFVFGSVPPGLLCIIQKLSKEGGTKINHQKYRSNDYLFEKKLK